MRIYILLALFLCCVSSLPIKKDQSDLKDLLLSSINGTNDPTVYCTACKSIVGILHLLMKSGEGKSIIDKVGGLICERFTSHRVCTLGVKVFSGQAWQIIASGLVQPNELCGLIFGDTCAHKTKFFSSWNVTIPGPTKFTPTSSDVGIKKGEGPTLKVLHISDTHLDLDYVEGRVAQCGDPLCCRKQDRMAKKGEAAAGKYGYPGFCDTNLLMLHTMFQHIHDNHGDLDYILWTGDVPPHNVWNQSRTDQKNAIHQATSFFKKYFPGKKVFPTLGNHEGVPVNFFPAPEIWDWSVPSTEWLYDSIAIDWGNWLPKECQETIKKGGFYTTLIQKGLRIISLNTNYGHKDNFWLAIMSHDPAKQLQWLVGVLLQAEKDGEKVHIIGHVPPNEVLHWWSFNFYKIVDRFQHTITGQFYGHTHHDEFRIFYDTKTYKKPTNIGYLGPSVTTFHQLNPGFRLYEVDAGYANSSLSVVDHHTYILDLEKVQKTGKAIFELEYSAKNAYKLKNLSPSAWNELLVRMEDDDELFQLLFRAFTKQYVVESCKDESCKRSYLCTMKKGMSGHDFCAMDEKEKKMFSRWESKTYNKC